MRHIDCYHQIIFCSQKPFLVRKYFVGLFFLTQFFSILKYFICQIFVLQTLFCSQKPFLVRKYFVGLFSSHNFFLFTNILFVKYFFYNKILTFVVVSTGAIFGCHKIIFVNKKNVRYGNCFVRLFFFTQFFFLLTNIFITIFCLPKNCNFSC